MTGPRASSLATAQAELQRPFTVAGWQPKLDLDDPGLDHQIVRQSSAEAYAVVSRQSLLKTCRQSSKTGSLPGPFAKEFFEQKLGHGACTTGRRRPNQGGVTMGYYDGAVEHIVDGVVTGHAWLAPGTASVSILCSFRRLRQDIFELGIRQNTISHRSKAAKASTCLPKLNSFLSKQPH